MVHHNFTWIGNITNILCVESKKQKKEQNKDDGLFCLKNNSGVKLGTKKLNKLHNALTHRSHTYKTRNKIQTNLTQSGKNTTKMVEINGTQTKMCFMST